MKNVKRGIIFACAGLSIIGVVIFMIGLLGPVIGPGALTFFAIKITGTLAIGAGISVLVILAGCMGIRHFAKERPDAATLFFECLQFLLSCLVYCGGSLFVLIGILSFDLQSITAFVRGILIAAGILSIVFMVWFRKYRKAHPKKMEHIGNFLIMMIFLVIGMAFLLGSLQEGVKFTKDMIHPSPIEEAILEDVRITYHYRTKAITSYYIKGRDRNGDERSFQIDFSTYKAWREHGKSATALSACVSYYKNTKIVYEITRF